jgi:hypothetical protein
LSNAAAALAKPDVQDFSRYEFKYLLNKRLRDTIESEVRHFMSYDGYADPALDNCYVVRSLYFDNAWASHYYEKTDGVKTRRKFRIRTYGKTFQPSVPIFLEEKGRHNERTYKHRLEIDPDELEMFCHPDRQFELIARYEGVSLIEAFVADTMRRHIQPRVLVDYIRRPYSSAFDTNFRLTFDSNLSAGATDMLFPPPQTRHYESVSGWTILEVKFHRRIPAWFHRILQAHDLRRLSISKFCKGMEICNLAEDLS